MWAAVDDLQRCGVDAERSAQQRADGFEQLGLFAEDDGVERYLVFVEDALRAEPRGVVQSAERAEPRMRHYDVRHGLIVQRLPVAVVLRGDPG